MRAERAAASESAPSDRSLAAWSLELAPALAAGRSRGRRPALGG